MPEATMTITVKQYRKMQGAAQDIADRYQEANKNQVEIINRMQKEITDLNGYKMLASVLLDRMKNTAEEDAGFDTPDEPFTDTILEREMVETDPSTWVGNLTKTEDGLDVFQIRLVPHVDVPVKPDGSPDVDAMNQQVMSNLDTDPNEDGGSNVHE